MHKAMSVVLVISLGFWSLATYGFLSVNTLLLTVLLAGVIFRNLNHTPDEREWQVHIIATYGSFMTTLCFLLVFQTLQYMKTATINPLFGYIMAVLMLSQLAFSMVLRKTAK